MQTVQTIIYSHCPTKAARAIKIIIIFESSIAAAFDELIKKIKNNLLFNRLHTQL